MKAFKGVSGEPKSNTFQISKKVATGVNFREDKSSKEPRSPLMRYRLREIAADRKFS
jgi:hypothetical protein